MTKRKVKSIIYLFLYGLPLLFVPIYLYGQARAGISIDIMTALTDVSNAFKVDTIYNWFVGPVELLVPNITNSTFAVYSMAYFSYMILLTFIDILVDAILWIPNVIHDALERRNF